MTHDPGDGPADPTKPLPGEPPEDHARRLRWLAELPTWEEINAAAARLTEADLASMLPPAGREMTLYNRPPREPGIDPED